MNDPKTEVFSKLSEIDDVTVYQERPEVLEVFPCITFRVFNNIPVKGLDRDIKKQDIVLKVDLWSETSAENSQLLTEVEEKLSELDYLLTFNQDVVDPSGIHHITTRFNY